MLLKLAWATEIISAFLIIVLVLMHSPKGDGIAGIVLVTGIGLPGDAVEDGPRGKRPCVDFTVLNIKRT